MSRIVWEQDSVIEPTFTDLQTFYLEHNIVNGGVGLSPIVFLDETAANVIAEHLTSDLAREQGGVLIGRPYYDPERDRYFVKVSIAIPAVGGVGTPVHFQFTPEAWEHISAQINEECLNEVVVGWYHSHPGLSVFMSGTDRASQRSFYNHPWSVALVVDPVRDEQAWFLGPDCQPIEPDRVVEYRTPITVPTVIGESPLSGVPAQVPNMSSSERWDTRTMLFAIMGLSIGTIAAYLIWRSRSLAREANSLD